MEWTSSGNGIVKVTETDVDGCIGNESTFDVNIDFGLNMKSMMVRKLNPYPNPFKEFTTISFDNQMEIILSCLFLTYGKKVHQLSNM